MSLPFYRGVVGAQQPAIAGNSVERPHTVVQHQACFAEGIIKPFVNPLGAFQFSGWARSPYSSLWDCCHPAVIWALKVQEFVLFAWPYVSQRHLCFSLSFSRPWLNLGGYTTVFLKLNVKMSQKHLDSFMFQGHHHRDVLKPMQWIIFNDF